MQTAGDDIVGIAEAVGSDVFEYRPGDRVAAFHKMSEPHGGYAEFSVAPVSTTFHLPPAILFEAGAGLPLFFMTAAIAIYQYLRVPLPTTPGLKDIPILIHGGASAVGAYALQLAKLSRLNPIITVAGSGIDFVKSLDAATHIVDYRKRNVAEDIIAATGGKKPVLAFDAICDHGSYEHITNVLIASGGGHINMVDPPEDQSWKFPEAIKFTRTYVSSAYGVKHRFIDDEQAAADGQFAYMFYRLLSHMLAEGTFKPHPYEVLPGMENIIEGVQSLYDGKVSAKKLIAR